MQRSLTCKLINGFCVRFSRVIPLLLHTLDGFLGQEQPRRKIYSSNNKVIMQKVINKQIDHRFVDEYMILPFFSPVMVAS